jgi:hypothetical protein
MELQLGITGIDSLVQKKRVCPSACDFENVTLRACLICPIASPNHSWEKIPVQDSPTGLVVIYI